jgi:hypothetical protein
VGTLRRHVTRCTAGRIGAEPLVLVKRHSRALTQPSDYRRASTSPWPCCHLTSVCFVDCGFLAVALEVRVGAAGDCDRPGSTGAPLLTCDSARQRETLICRTLVPLTDSNRRPHPYHAEVVATGAKRQQRIASS